MRKEAFTISLASLVLGIFGFFLRWLQNINGFEEDTGLAIPGAPTAIVFLIYSLLVLAVFIVFNRMYFRRRELGAQTDAIQSPTAVHSAVLWVCAVLGAIAWLILMFSADERAYPMMQRATAALGILASASLPFILPSKKAGDSRAIGATAAIIPILFCCVWLITDYRVQSENPVRWEYVVEILAVAALTMSFYHLAAYFYGKAKPASCLLFCRISAYLCLCTLTDGHDGAKLLFFIVCAIFMFAAQFILLENGKQRD